MTALAHDTQKEEASTARAKLPVVAVAPRAFEETDTAETPLEYGPGSFNWPVRIVWAGFVVLCVWYVAQYYVPSLVAWLPWKP